MAKENPLVGRGFLVFSTDGSHLLGQGEVVGRVEENFYLLDFYSIGDGCYGQARVVEVHSFLADGWEFHPSFQEAADIAQRFLNNLADKRRTTPTEE